MAGTRTSNRLTAQAVDKQRRPGLYADGAGLTLVVTENGVKRWELRAMTNGRRRQLGLGVYPQVSLEAARRKAVGLREAVRQGAAVPAARQSRPATNSVDAGPVTFRAVFESYFELKAPQLPNPKHAAQWRSTLETYVFPTIGRTAVAAVTAADIIDILKPIWNDKPETAKRVHQRMRVVFEAAIVRGDRTTAAPTTGVSTVLGARRRTGHQHHAALPYSEVAALIGRLRQFEGRAATRLAFEFLILTASRSGEVRLATWPKFDRAAALWTIPADRMKAREAHVVPLCGRALQILEEARSVYPSCDLVFPGAAADKPLSDMTLTKVLRDFGLGGRATAHGFRSSSKDWCAEVAKVRDEVSEAALAHKIPDKVRAAYLRTKFLDDRRDLMQQWADYLASTPHQATVVGRR